MTTGAEIADRLVAANEEAIACVLGPAAGCWDELTVAERWPVGVTARHIALGHELMVSWSRAIKSGAAITGVESIDAANAEQAARGIVAAPDEVAQMLRDNVRAAVEALCELSEPDLGQEIQFGPHVLPAATVADAAVRHVRTHLDSIRRAVEASTTSQPGSG